MVFLVIAKPLKLSLCMPHLNFLRSLFGVLPVAASGHICPVKYCF